MPNRPDEIRRRKGGHDRDRARGHLHDGRAPRREAELGDDDAGEVGHGAVVDHGEERDEEQRPGLLVPEQELDNLVRLEPLVLDAGLVDAHVLDDGDALLLSEKPLSWGCRGGRGW